MSFPPPEPAALVGGAAEGDDVSFGTTPPDPTPESGPSARPGDVTQGWRMMLGLGWIAAFFAYAGVWQASVQIGIGTWWIGPRAQPSPLPIRLVPFVLCLAVSLLVVYNVRWVVRWSAIGVVGAAAVSIPDFSRTVGLGSAEALIAVMLGIITLSALSGRYRVLPATPAR